MTDIPGAAQIAAMQIGRQTVLRRLANNGAAASVIEVLLTGGILLLAFRIVISSSSLKQFGVWALIQSLTSVIKMADVGIAGALPKFIGQMSVSDRSKRIWPYIDTAIIFTFLFYIIIACVAYYPIDLLLARNLEPDQVPLARVMLPLVLGNAILWSVSSVPIAALVGIREGTRKSVINVAGSCVMLGSAVMLAPRFQVMALAIAQSIQFCFLIIAAWACLSRRLNAVNFRFSLRFDSAIIRETIGLSLLTQANTAMAQFYDVVVRLVLTRAGGTASTAVYELVERVFQPVRVLLIGPAFLSVPVLARAFVRKRFRAIRRIYERQVVLIAAAAIVVYIGVALSAPVVSYVLLNRVDSNFLTVFFIDWIATFVYVLCIPGMLFGPASGRLHYNLIGNVGQLSGSALVGTLLGAVYGPWVALGGIVCVYILASVFQSYANTGKIGVAMLPSRHLLAKLRHSGGLKLLFRPIMS
jgi:O-antigen/teichoic acid export membrane protein